MASPQLGNAPSGSLHGSVRSPSTPKFRVWSSASAASFVRTGGSGSFSVSVTTRPLLVACTTHSGCSSSWSAIESTGVHSAPTQLPLPSKARTTPQVSTAKGTKSSVKPSHRGCDPSLSGSGPAAHSALDLVSSKRKSKSSSLPGDRVITKSNAPLAASATLWPGMLKTNRGKPLKVYKRKNLFEVSTATKSSPHATASGISLMLSGAEKKAFSQRRAGRSSTRAPVAVLLEAARHTMPSEMDAMLRPS
mmetsp:Transcript_127719/g.303434  ORF Transcript_127719/g.303434 Transcript_127719/m.303434 type:complete len:249 (-) Transcript_127719:321-1067(-)